MFLWFRIDCARQKMVSLESSSQLLDTFIYDIISHMRLYIVNRDRNAQQAPRFVLIKTKFHFKSILYRHL